MTKTIDMSHKRGEIEELKGQRANIKAVGLVHQPKSWAELEAWLERLHSGERAVAMTAAMMAWNLAARFDAHNEATEGARNAKS